jgi:hypothetical protein
MKYVLRDNSPERKPEGAEGAEVTDSSQGLALQREGGIRRDYAFSEERIRWSQVAGPFEVYSSGSKATVAWAALHPDLLEYASSTWFRQKFTAPVPAPTASVGARNFSYIQSPGEPRPGQRSRWAAAPTSIWRPLLPSVQFRIPPATCPSRLCCPPKVRLFGAATTTVLRSRVAPALSRFALGHSYLPTARYFPC